MRLPDKTRKPTWRWPAAIIISVAIVCTTYLAIIFKTEISDQIITRTKEMELLQKRVEYLDQEIRGLIEALNRKEDELAHRDRIIRDLEWQLGRCKEGKRFERFESTNAYRSINPK